MQNFTETLALLGIKQGEKMNIEKTLIVRDAALESEKKERKKRKGVPVTDATKMLMRSASNTKTLYMTPLGIFDSAFEACMTHGITLNELKTKIWRGDRQRAGLKVHHPDENDCRQWGRSIIKHGNIRRPVITPFGRFNTVTAAAKFEGKSPASILRSIREYPDTYKYE